MSGVPADLRLGRVYPKYISPEIPQSRPSFSPAFVDHAHSCHIKLPMAPESVTASDPFADLTHPVEDPGYAENSTLPVGRDASLTLATDSLIVLGRHFRFCKYTKADRDQDEDFMRRGTRNCCGLFPSSMFIIFNHGMNTALTVL